MPLENPGPARPMLVSFAYGEEYYHRAAALLREDCERLGVDSHVVRVELPPGTSWIDACRHKVRFIADCHARFERPVWWVDVDCRLLAPLPDVGAATDLGFFLRGFRDMRHFDPVALPRVIQPSILYFGRTATARRFLQLMAEAESTFAGTATDDWFIQEAWVRLEQAPAIAVMPPSWVQLDDATAAGVLFRFGRSGQAGRFKDEAAQHEVDLFSPARRKALFLRETSQALKNGNGVEASFFLRKAQQADPQDEALAYRVARGLQKEGRLEEAERILSRLPPSDQAADHLSRFRLDVALQAGDAFSAQAIAARLQRGDSEGDRRWAASRQLRIGLELRAKKARVRLARRPRLWWMESPYPGNFGDILNPYLVEKFTGLPPVHCPKGEGALAIGSTIRFALDGTTVWGTGTPRMSDRLNPRAHYLAVRGPLTARLVAECGGAAPEILGDPAVLLPRFYQPRQAARRHALGVVLHHAHEGQLQFEGDVRVIGVLREGYEGIEAFIDEICSCERVLSSSLHGLIVSHAYGVPAQWFTVTDGTSDVPGDGTKYHDYLLSVGLEAGEPLRLQPGDKVHPRLPTSESLPRKPIEQDRLLSVAPWRPRQERRWW
ncbi:polysaccharide pyruvyl transferase family protein [Ideonella sp. YS5]|uniref:polysaccharide pyruvyl transferase family protein n=1 Tax=Ideonella sp. YS5 TaxID=3453714 RepID=UPI003EEC7882